MSTYAAYYNLVQADKAAQQASQQSSRRASKESTTSTTSTSSNKSRRQSIKNALEFLRPTTEEITPAGIYSPIIKRGPLFSGMKPTNEPKEPTPIYAGLSQRDRPLFGRSKKTSKKADLK